MQEKKRPLGIVVLSIFNIIVGILVILGSFDMASEIWLILFGLGLFALVVGIGLFRLEPWARYLAITGYTVNLFVSLSQRDYINIFISSIIIWYLRWNEEVRNAFSVS